MQLGRWPSPRKHAQQKFQQLNSIVTNVTQRRHCSSAEVHLISEPNRQSKIKQPFRGVFLSRIQSRNVQKQKQRGPHGQV